jgi:single-strand DNA-binding protein
MSLNSVNIMGNLTRDPELKTIPSGKSVCSLSIANNRVYTKNGERVTEVSYFDIEVWGVIAENCAKYLKKGSGIIVEGRLKQDRWEKDGKTQSKVRIAANSIHFMPRKDGGGGQRPADADPAQEALDAAVTPQDIAWEE